MRAFNRTDDFFMTVTTGLFDDLEAMWFYLNVVFVETSREVERVPEPVRRFCRILTDEIFWCVTAVADSNGSV